MNPFYLQNLWVEFSKNLFSCTSLYLGAVLFTNEVFKFPTILWPMTDYNYLIEQLIPAVKKAGEAIMRIYHQGVEHTLKQDGSPVTKADKAAELIILDALNKLNTGITIISEENPESHALKPSKVFFLVDPLDGTKEFLKCDGKGAFTVNVALIENHVPVMGIIYAPALGRMFYGSKENGAFENGKPIGVRKVLTTQKVAVASESHRDAQTDEWLKNQDIKNIVSIGSSLKFCLIACGEADIYPRFSPTMEWDTAAGDAILRAAGGMVSHMNGSPFKYGKKEYRNDAFIAVGQNI